MIDLRPHGGDIQHEYIRLCATYPDPLPLGYTFPKSPPSTVDTGNPFGFALAYAYLDWQSAHAIEALRASRSGNSALAKQHLDIIEAGYRSDLRRVAIEDPELGYLRDAIEPARRGDFDLLIELSIDTYLSNPERAAIARAAKNLIYGKVL